MAEKTRSEYATLNILTGLGGYVFNIILSTVCRMIFTRIFTADYLGVSGLFSNLIGMLSLAELGVGAAIVYALYEPLAKKNNAKVAALIKFYSKCYRFIGAVVFAVGLLMVPFLNVIITEKPDIDENFYLIYLIQLFSVASSYFFSYRSSLLVAAQKNYMVTVLSNIMAFVQNIVQIVVIITLKSYIGYLLVALVGVFITNVYSYFLAQKEFPYINDKNIAPLEKTEKQDIMRNVRALLVNRIGNLMLNSTDNIIITWFKNLATVGMMSNYNLLTTNATALLNIIFNSLNSSVGNHNVLESKESKLSMFYTINFANFWLYAWSAIGFFVLATDAVAFLYGENYRMSLEIPLALAINYYITVMQNSIWTYFNTHGLFTHCKYLVVLTGAINLVLSFALGNIWGVFGILIATTISRLCTTVWYYPYAICKYVFNLSYLHYLKRYIAFLLILIATGTVCWFICSFINFSLVVNIILKFIVCCVVPNAVFFCLFRKRQEFKTLLSFVSNFINRIKAKLKKA